MSPPPSQWLRNAPAILRCCWILMNEPSCLQHAYSAHAIESSRSHWISYLRRLRLGMNVDKLPQILQSWRHENKLFYHFWSNYSWISRIRAEDRGCFSRTRMVAIPDVTRPKDRAPC